MGATRESQDNKPQKSGQSCAEVKTLSRFYLRQINLCLFYVTSGFQEASSIGSGRNRDTSCLNLPNPLFILLSCAYGHRC